MLYLRQLQTTSQLPNIAIISHDNRDALFSSILDNGYEIFIQAGTSCEIIGPMRAKRDTLC